MILYPLLSGYKLMTIFLKQVERVLLRQFHHSRDYVTGTLCLTDRHLIFIEPTGMQETWVRATDAKVQLTSMYRSEFHRASPTPTHTS